MREGELLGLLWSDIDFNKGWLQVQRSLEGSKDGDPKTEQIERDIPFSPFLFSHRQIELHRGSVNPSNLHSRYFDAHRPGLQH